MPSSAELRARYAALADEELLELSARPQDLTSDGQAALAAELQQRGLSATGAADLPSPSDPDEQLWRGRRRALSIRVVGLLPALIGGLIMIGAGLSFLKSSQIPLADRLAILSATATGILVVVTTIYVRITGDTLSHLREERTSASQPTLFVDLVESVDGQAITLRLVNLGLGPAIRVRGACVRGTERADARHVHTSIRGLPEFLPVNQAAQFTIPLTTEDLEQVSTKDGHRFLVIRFEFLDARRNLYEQEVELDGWGTGRDLFFSTFGERVWRTTPRSRPFLGRLLAPDISDRRKVLYADRRLGVTVWDWRS